MACIASPELPPGGAWPQMLNDGKLLNRSSRGDPSNQWPEAKEANGVIVPALLRT